MSDLLSHDNAISAQEIKTCDDLSPFREWFIMLLKNSSKLMSTVNSDFINEINNLEAAKSQLHLVMIKNEELEMLRFSTENRNL